jgi:glycosyltransferase involved in cell wall biosynthesis
MTKLLIISGDTVGSNMGGVGVRNWELAHALSNCCEVTLAVPNNTDLTSERVKIVSFVLEGGDLRPYAQGSDLIIMHGFVLHFHPYLVEMNIPIAVDLYVPSLLEGLVWHDEDDWKSWIPSYEEYLRVQLELLLIGDYFFCASERQRDYWLGWLHAQKRINPHTYRQDPTLRQLIDVVPFGLPSKRPVKTGSVLKGTYPGIAEDDKVILWAGGLWDWLDPITLIHAMAELVPNHPELKLYFLGTRHPNPIVSGMQMPDQTIALSQDLGLFERSIFFGEWVAYEQRVNYLLEADLSVITHPAHIETRFSNRTRALDCIWTGLPIITTEGDAMADLVQAENIGFTVPPEDIQALTVAIDRMLAAGGRRAYSESFNNLRDRLSWDKVVEPLADYCSSPNFAPDKGLYLTELERYRKNAEAHLQRVITEKDAFLEKVVRDKDAHLEQVIKDKDEVIESLNNRLEQYSKILPVRVYRGIRRRLGKS